MDDKEEKETDQFDSPCSGSLKMRSSLKEKLKRKSRTFVSPVCGIQASQTQESASVSMSPNHQNIEYILSLSDEDIGACNDASLLQNILLELRKQYSRKEETLRKLEPVKCKLLQDIENLNILIQKWLSVTQEAVKELHKKLPDSGNLSEFINTLNLDYDVIKFNPECDDFA